MKDQVGGNHKRARFQALCQSLRPDLLRFAFWLSRDRALAAEPTAVAIQRSDAHEGCDLLSVELAQFRQLGDEGGAYWIGRAAVRAALRWEDGLDGGSARIHRAVIQAAGQDLDALIGEVCTHPAERGRLTALAPVVTALAGEDPEARIIALRAAEHLADLAESIRRRLGPLPVAGAGRVFGAPLIWDRFAELTGAVRPLAAATVGAALLAGQPAGVQGRQQGGQRARGA